MNKVVEILMKRDGIEQHIAEALVAETRDEILALDDASITEADDIIQEYLGLEPDYLVDILGF